ncbi:MAG: leucine-rich repeat protein, partial [Bacteroidaceae bacterium]|nr:leucine-rich repeat protein [Bacteroidaceae bacterium]
YKGYPKNVSIPYGIIEIGDCAFADCESLTAVEIPDSVEIIGESAFLRLNLSLQ